MKKRGCIVSKLMAQMLTKAGMTHLITMDLHQKEVEKKNSNLISEKKIKEIKFNLRFKVSSTCLWII